MTTIYWREWYDHNGFLWRLEIEAAGTAEAIEVFVEITEAFSADVGSIELGWESAPYGLMKAGSTTIKLDVRSIEQSALRDIILRPIVADVGALDLGGGSTRSIDGATIWRFYCDGGAGYASGSDDLRGSLVFEGVQRTLPKRRHEIEDAGTDSVSHDVEVTLVDIVRVAAEQVKAQDLVSKTFNTRTAVGPYDTEFDVIYYDEADDLIYARMEGQPTGLPIWRRYYRLDHLYLDLAALIGDAFRALKRRSTSQFFFNFVGEFNKPPLEHLALAKQNYLPDNLPDMTAPTVYYNGTSHMANDSGNQTVPVGGILIDQKQDNQHSLFRFRTMYDFLRVSLEGFGLVGRHTRFGTLFESAAIEFQRLTDVQGVTTIASEDLPGKVGIDEPAELVAKAVVAVPGLEGDDQAEYESSVYWGASIEDEEDENIRALWHNMPRVGDRANAEISYRWTFGGIGGTSTSKNRSVINGDYVGVISEDITPWKLYYIENPLIHLTGGGTKNLLTNARPIRISSWCTLEYGTGPIDKVFAGSGGPFPLLQSPVANQQQLVSAIQTWWGLLIAQYLETQRNAGLHQCVAEAVALVFGNTRQAAYTDLALTLADITPNLIGHTITLGDTGNASVFLAPGETYLDHLDTKCHTMNLKIPLNGDDVTATMIHIEVP